MLSGKLEDISGHKLTHLVEDRLKVLVLGRDLCLMRRLINGTILEDVVEHGCLVHACALAMEYSEHLKHIRADLVGSMVKL